MVQWIIELDQDTHHLLVQFGSDQTQEVTMSPNEGGGIWHLCNQFFKHSENLDKVDLDGVLTHGCHDLQNRTKMNPSCL